MILLSGHSLSASRVIRDEALRLSLKERESTADWTPESMSGISVNSWVKSAGGPGDGIVWRVQSIEQDYGEDTPTVRLEHVINTLRDTIMFGEITPEDMGGSDGSCTAQQAVTGTGGLPRGIGNRRKIAVGKLLLGNDCHVCKSDLL